VIGGTSILGGWGGYGGTILGVLILTVLGSLLTLLDAEEWERQVIYGSIIIVLTAIYARATRSD
jgi:ribose transport system permease protein